MNIHRRTVIKAGVGLAAAMFIPGGGLFAQAQTLIQKKIPSSGETIPIIGIGTARRYEDIKNDADKVPLRETLRQFQALGGKVIDSSPSYGTAEAVVGELTDGLKVRDSLFLATKVSLRNIGRAEGMAQIEQSFKKLRTNKIDLIAVHNLRDTDTQLRTLRDMKQAGRIRYAGITTSFDNQYAEFEQVIKKETPRLHPGRLRLGQPRCRRPHHTAGGRPRLSGDGQSAVWPWPAVQGGARQETAGVGERIRLPIVAAIFSQVHCLSSGDYLRGSRHGANGIRRRQPRCRTRSPGRWRHAAQNGTVH